ncbi:GNAT family N-acetyltransferase [Streptomyces sp. URMC 126]|uniref:GNAT family N-acetyltransferase n=1 Tax=Streptomyces sp. URMC 126 TaxID=3423401 RepID=UPI003F1C02BF
MNEAVKAEVLAELDALRRASGVVDGHADLVREYSADGSECRIVFAGPAGGEVGELVRAERELARSGGYTLEWKVYGHDRQRGLAAALEAAGFVPGDEEQVLVLPVAEASAALFDTSAYEVRQVTDGAGLDDYAEISRQVGRRNADEERRQLVRLLEEQPEAMSVHIAYAQGEPVSCGRVHFQAGSPIAELAGARTKTTHRRQGFFTAVVGSRLRQAVERGCRLLVTDALPTSEPILRKRGFEAVTSTRPYLFEPAD